MIVHQYLPPNISKFLTSMILDDRSLSFEKRKQEIQSNLLLNETKSFQHFLSLILVEIKIWKNLISSIVTTFLRVFRLGRKCHNSRQLACVFDLTRQHLPPYIAEFELRDFFFQAERPVLRQEADQVAVLLNGYRTKTHDLPDLFFQDSFLELTQQFFPSRRKELKAVIFSTLSVCISALFIPRNGDIRHILLDIFEVRMFLDSKLSNSLIEAVITTSSFFTKSPAIFYLRREKRNFQTEMMHYSENTFPLTILEKNVGNHLDWIPNSRVDLHKVWTQKFAFFLSERLPLANISVIGSMIFQSFPSSSQIFTKKNQIAVFDVMPSTHESFNGPYTIYSGTRFLHGLKQIKCGLAAVLKDPPTLIIKHKRRVIPGHNKDYLKLKNELMLENWISEINWDTNLYNFIGESCFVICMPGTAPAIIAKELRVPVIYLYLGSNPLCEPFVDYGIPVFQSVDEATEYIISIIIS